MPRGTCEFHRTTWEFFLPPCGHYDRTQDVRFGSKKPYLLDYVASPFYSFPFMCMGLYEYTMCRKGIRFPGTRQVWAAMVGAGNWALALSPLSYCTRLPHSTPILIIYRIFRKLLTSSKCLFGLCVKQNELVLDWKMKVTWRWPCRQGGSTRWCHTINPDGFQADLYCRETVKTNA